MIFCYFGWHHWQDATAKWTLEHATMTLGTSVCLWCGKVADQEHINSLTEAGRWGGLKDPVITLDKKELQGSKKYFKGGA